MKKILLTLAVASSTIAFAQTLQSENYNNLTIGNIGTDFTGAVAGQSSFFTLSSNGAAPTTSNNAAASNFQVIANGNNGSKGLQLISQNGDKGSSFMWKDGLDASWATRTSGNNVIELEYSFFTGPVTDSRTQSGMRIYGTQDVAGTPTSRVLNGFVYTANTRNLSGVAYLKNGANFGTYTINLAAAPGLILDANTWYTIGCSYNTVTGETTWKTSPTTPISTLAAANYVPGMVPAEVDYVQSVIPANATSVPPVPANTSASTIIFDDYISRAVATSNLLSSANFTTANEAVSIYPNPATDVLNLKVSDSNTISSVQIVDLNGRQVFTKSFENVSDTQINVNDLSAGMYLINITSGDKSVTKKFLKQ